jgi:hypothetical protein
VLEINEKEFQFMDDKFKDDKEIVIKVVSNFGENLQFASDRLKKDANIVLKAIRNNGIAIQYAVDKFKDNKELVLLAVEKEGENLKYLSKRLKDDEELVFKAGSNDNFALRFASKRTREKFRKIQEFKQKIESLRKPIKENIKLRFEDLLDIIHNEKKDKKLNKKDLEKIVKKLNISINELENYLKIAQEKEFLTKNNAIRKKWQKVLEDRKIWEKEIKKLKGLI